MDNLPEVLEFTKEHNVTFTIISEGGEYLVLATLDRVSAKYAINPNDPATLAGAVWAALGSVKGGIEFHTIHGYTPGLNLGQGYPRVGGSGGESPNSKIHDHASRQFYPPPLQRRD